MFPSGCRCMYSTTTNKWPQTGSEMEGNQKWTRSFGPVRLVITEAWIKAWLIIKGEVLNIHNMYSQATSIINPVACTMLSHSYKTVDWVQLTRFLLYELDSVIYWWFTTVFTNSLTIKHNFSEYTQNSFLFECIVPAGLYNSSKLWVYQVLLGLKISLLRNLSNKMNHKDIR